MTEDRGQGREDRGQGREDTGHRTQDTDLDEVVEAAESVGIMGLLNIHQAGGLVSRCRGVREG